MLHHRVRCASIVHMAKLIGLTGKAGAGKNEAANALTKIGWKQDAFADRMRTAMLALDPWVFDFDGGVRLSVLVNHLGWDEAKRNHPEVRRLLQKFGTEAGRDIHGKDCWVDALFRDLDINGPHLTPPMVVTDVRFDNEALAINKRGGIVIEIVRPGLEELAQGNSAHASEAGLSRSLIDYTIENNGTIEMLHGNVLVVLGNEVL